MATSHARRIRIAPSLLAADFARLRDDIFAGRMDPFRVHEQVEPYSVEAQMSRLFAHHRRLQAPERRADNVGV